MSSSSVHVLPESGPKHFVLVYIMKRGVRQVLLQYHKNDPNDDSYLRYNGISTRLRQDETMTDAARRAMLESGLPPQWVAQKPLLLRATVQWTKYAQDRQPVLGFLFEVDGAGLPENQEHDDENRVAATDYVMANRYGYVKWFEMQELLLGHQQCWPGDAYIFPLLFDPTAHQFHGLMLYSDGLPVEWRYSRLNSDSV